MARRPSVLSGVTVAVLLGMPSVGTPCPYIPAYLQIAGTAAVVPSGTPADLAAAIDFIDPVVGDIVPAPGDDDLGLAVGDAVPHARLGLQPEIGPTPIALWESGAYVFWLEKVHRRPSRDGTVRLVGLGWLVGEGHRYRTNWSLVVAGGRFEETARGMPEPAAALLLAVGAFAVAAAVRRRARLERARA